MRTFPRNSLLGAFALMASLSAPLAFAQSAVASAQATAATPPAVKSDATNAQGNTAANADTATEAATGAGATAGPSPARKSWSDVDADKDGKLTKAEVRNVPELGQVFDLADSNADGSLTTGEYKAYVAQIQGGIKGKVGGK